MPFTPRRLVPIILSALFALPVLVAAQEPATITGKVTSDAGLPLGQVEIAIPSMGLGALSKDDGRYTLVVPGARVSGQTVTIVGRRLGYKSQTAQLTLTAGGVTHDFTLAANPLQLGEVVVTGAGTATETGKLGNVRNSVAAADIERAGETNAVQGLAGKAPNVTVVQQSGDPGAGSFINIRGISSILGSNQPLFIVDGVPMDNSTFSTSNFNAAGDGGTGFGGFGQTEGTVAGNRLLDLNPNDIEAVEILKGPAASAVYGSRAGFGVILITTKSGRAGPTRFTFRSATSFDDVNHNYPLQTLWGQGNHGAAVSACTAPCTRTSLSWGPAIGSAPVYDHASEIYDGGNTLDNGITISGGNDRTTFYLSGDNSYQKGVFVGPNNHLSRTAVRAKGSHRLTDNLKIAADLAFADTRASYIQRGNNLNGVQLGDLRTPANWNNQPYFVTTTAGIQSRSYRFPYVDATTLTRDRIYDNPFWTLFQQANTSNVGRVYGNVSAEYLALSWLKFNYTLGADYSADERLEGVPVSSANFPAGRVVEGKIINYQIDHNLTATATYTINPDFAGSVTVGQNLNARNTRLLGTTGLTFAALQPFKLSNTVTQALPIDAEEVVHTAGWLGQGTLDMYNQVHLTAAVRNDGSSTFGQSNLRSWFPKGSVAWEFTKLIGEQRWLSYGKLRAAYGEAGVEPQPYLTSQIFSSSALLGGIAQGTGNSASQGGLPGLASSTTKAATSLKPERSKEFEAGADLGFFSDRADASVTYYNKISSDVILLSPLAPSSGFLFQGANSAKLRNQGWEVSLNVRPFQQADYGWEVGVQWARNRSLVEALGGQQFISIGDFINQVAMVNQPIGVYLGAGFLRCGYSSNANVVDTIGTTLGTYCAGAPKGALFIGGPASGTAGFPQPDPDPRLVMDPNYNWTGSVRSTVRYRKLQFSGLVDVRVGGQIWNGTKGALYNFGKGGETAVRSTFDAFGNEVGNLQAFGSGGWWPGPVVGPGAGTKVSIGENWYRNYAACPYVGIDEPCIEDAGFVKLRELSVSYTIDAPWVQRNLGFSSIDVRVSGRNLKTWTNYTGYDPETSLGGVISSSGGAGGVDYFNNPQTRSFAFSITLNH
jgi:TonB-linked SusC/RagA family outer membrane protein